MKELHKTIDHTLINHTNTITFFVWFLFTFLHFLGGWGGGTFKSVMADLSYTHRLGNILKILLQSLFYYTLASTFFKAKLKQNQNKVDKIKNK